MAYNYNFPVGYQNYYPQYQQQTQTQTQSPLNWVQGEAGAKSFLVAPGNTVTLWDSEAQVIYLKSADASGMPSMRILDYTIREESRQTHKKGTRGDFATKEDILLIQDQIDQIKANLGRRKAVQDESVIPAT